MGIIYKFANIHFYFEYTNRLSIFIFFSGPLSAIKFQKAEGRRGSKYRADEDGKEAFFAKSHHRQTDSEKEKRSSLAGKPFFRSVLFREQRGEAPAAY